MFTIGGAVFTEGGATQNCYGPPWVQNMKKITRVWPNNCTDNEGWVVWIKKSTVGGAQITVGGAVFTVRGAVFTVGGAKFRVGGAEFTIGGAVFTVGGAVFTVGGAMFRVGGACLQ